MPIISEAGLIVEDPTLLPFWKEVVTMSRQTGRAENAYVMIRKLVDSKRALADKLRAEADELEKMAPAEDPRQEKMPGMVGLKK